MVWHTFALTKARLSRNFSSLSETPSAPKETNISRNKENLDPSEKKKKRPLGE
jgi:hypothetical protein